MKSARAALEALGSALELPEGFDHLFLRAIGRIGGEDPLEFAHLFLLEWYLEPNPEELTLAAASRVLDRIRKRLIRDLRKHGHLPSEHLSGVPAVDEASKIQLQEMRSVLSGESDPLFLLVFELYYEQGYTLEELGKTLGVSTSHAHRWVGKCRSLLRRVFGT